MIRINIGGIKDLKEDLSKFLKEKTSVEPKIEGEVMTLEGVDESKLSVAFVKTYLKRFLYNKRLRRSYRLSVNKKEISILAVKKEEIMDAE